MNEPTVDELQVQLAQVIAQRDTALARLAHKENALEAKLMQVSQLTAERDSALAKCAEMRELLKLASGEVYHSDKLHFGPECPGCKLRDKINNVLLSCDCGKGWHSPAEWAELQAKCQQMRGAFEKIRDLEPAQNCGSLFYPMFDGDGNQTGEQGVDPLSLLQEIFTEVGKALSTTPPPVVPAIELEATLKLLRFLLPQPVEDAEDKMIQVEIKRLEQLKGAK